MNFDGAWDYGYLKRIMEGRAITPRQSLLANKTTAIRIAQDDASQDLLIYVPHNTKLRLNGNFSNYAFEAIDLADRFTSILPTRVKDGLTILDLQPFHEDVLIIGTKNEKE